ncbi:E3 ubiquitin-protein ligase TRIM56-like [Patiria miniata]|uniref:Uncharacterized protein n=1 Tax=Patiria miniata TaxID=46514 RepID=A0A913ZQI6_PATMI|nr:E3 ubiquitin-protein ligase TRIM56-like [Patiria miniata]
MAEAAAQSVLGTISRGHLECPICCCRFADPKMLDCLHNFCLNCLLELISRQQPNADEITCPVCRWVTAVPDTGLQGLPNCFFLSSLVDEFNKQERLLEDARADTRSCEECDEGLEAVSRCLDCDGNICQKCLDAHRKMKSTKKHRIVNFDPSRSQDFRKKDFRKEDWKQCHKHTNQELCFYCETCKTLACVKCAALDHRGAEHEYREVADAIRSYRLDVEQILQRFRRSEVVFKVTDESLTHARNRVRIMVARACKDITAKEEEIAKIRDKSRLLRDKVSQIGAERDRKFEEDQKSNRDKMERAEQIVAAVNNLIQQADDFELLDLKPKVMHNLKFHKKLKLRKAQHELSFIGVKCQDVVTDTHLGEVLQEKKWEMREEIFNVGQEEFETVTGIACLSNGDIVVVDNDKKQLMNCTSTGKYEGSVGREKLNDPWGVAATSDDLLLVTDKDYVKVFDCSLEFIHQFASSKDAENVDSKCRLDDIAVDKNNRIAVADRGRKLISLHHMDGSLITTIPHGDMVGGYLAIGIKERLIFTNYLKNQLICTTYTGDEVFNVDTSIGEIPVIIRPSGVCCDDAGDIYVSVDLNKGESVEVHHYSPEGVFIGCVARGIWYPGGLAFMQSRDLVVADCVTVKIFHRV